MIPSMNAIARITDPGTVMFSKLCALLCMLALGACSGTGVYNEYPFSAPEDVLSDADEFTTWSAALETHRVQLPDLYACRTGGYDKKNKKCRGRLRTFNRAMERAQALTPDEQIELVNFYINRGRYDSDHRERLYDEEGEKAGFQRNHWKSLFDFLVKGGDCEDFATSKYFMLRELGFAAEDLRIVVTWEQRERGYHAVLAVRRPDNSVWLLDSDNSVKKNSHSGYRYVYAMNETTVWDHRDDFVGQAELGNSTITGNR